MRSVPIARRPSSGWTGFLPVALVLAAALLGAWCLPVATASLGAVHQRAAVLGTQCMTMIATGSCVAWAGGVRAAGGWVRSHRGLLGGLLAQATPQAGAGRVTAWAPLAPGIRLRTVEVGNGVRLRQVELDPAVARVQILHFAGKAYPVADMARRGGAVAAVNASYFDHDTRPLGYLKINGRVVNPDVATGGAFTGVFTIVDGKPRIVARGDFDPAICSSALQAGPRLVAGGKPTRGLRETRSFRQSGVAVTRAGRVVIYATDGAYSGLTWEQTRRVLLSPAAKGGVDPRDVLNLDGGSSSQLCAGRVSTGFPSRVPVAIGFRRK